MFIAKSNKFYWALERGAVLTIQEGQKCESGSDTRFGIGGVIY